METVNQIDAVPLLRKTAASFSRTSIAMKQNGEPDPLTPSLNTAGFGIIVFWPVNVITDGPQAGIRALNNAFDSAAKPFCLSLPPPFFLLARLEQLLEVLPLFLEERP